MTLCILNDALQHAHHNTATSLTASVLLTHVSYVSELENSLVELHSKYKARCREVFNLRIVLKDEQLADHAERLELLEEFTDNGIAKHYYHYQDSFELSEVKLTRPVK